MGEIRLTTLAHGGGCGCKLAPAVLTELLAGSSMVGTFPQLLVGNETGDDAAVWRQDEETCIIATTDFFMPMVDDPGDFGRIAAANAISDVYAMGGTPIFALAVLGMPLGKIDAATVRLILQGGAAICAKAAIPVAGGHSIDAPEPIYGLAVIGTCKPEALRRNSDAKPGDAIILTKPIGVGIYSAAFKKGALPSHAYDELIATTTLLNAVGADLGKDDRVHAMTDVTGFGLLGHAVEVARGSSAILLIETASLPLLGHAEELAQEGYITGASERNWASYDRFIGLQRDTPDWRRSLLTDPQTSGGLLVTCTPQAAQSVVAAAQNSGCAAARIIGRVEAGEPHVRVES